MSSKPTTITVIHSSILSSPAFSAEEKDQLDELNRPRCRAKSILSTLKSKTPPTNKFNLNFISPLAALTNRMKSKEQVNFLKSNYEKVHDPKMVEFLCTAWEDWSSMGTKGRDAACFHPAWYVDDDDDDDDEEDDDDDNNEEKNNLNVPPLIPQNFVMKSRKSQFPQRPSNNVMGKMGYYCTDQSTPIVSSLRAELLSDAEVINSACSILLQDDSCRVSYALTIHPGHHSSHSSFGGYCYLNNAAMAAVNLLRKKHNQVAILDIDYHCGNGTAEIVTDDEKLLYVSLHCDPNVEFPFHCGYREDNTDTTFHIPLRPGIGFKGRGKEKGYEDALNEAFDVIDRFGPIDALVVSMGLDTFQSDPIAVPEGGFQIGKQDFVGIGKVIGSRVSVGGQDNLIPTLFVQEGGYVIEDVGELVFNVLKGFVDGQKDDLPRGILMDD